MNAQYALQSETFVPAENSRSMAEIHNFLSAHAASGRSPIEPRYFLAGSEPGDQVEIPPEVHAVLRQVISAMGQGLAVTVSPQSRTLTTQQAADLLGISRPTLVKLLDAGDIPFEKVSTHRRVLLRDVLDYREKRRAAQYEVLEATSVAIGSEDDLDETLADLREARRVVAARRRSAKSASHDGAVFTSLLDTCVLWPSKQRDFLLSLAVEGLYRPVWSSAVLEELEFHEARKLIKRGTAPEDAATLASSLLQNMRRAFVDAEVTGWEALEGTYGLPDPDDEHVVAAAVIAGAGSIVTLNTRDFPQDLMPNGISVVSPADFAWETVNLSPTTALHAVEEMASRSGRNGPKETVDEILNVLVSRYGMAEAVDSMRSVLPQHKTE